MGPVRDGCWRSPAWSLWYALARGYQLGFIASSDHVATHLSYACVWAAEKTRPAIFDAISSRRTYAATDRIVLDFRIDGAILGEEIDLAGRPVTVKLRALGTAPITELEIIRSGKVIHQSRPNVRELKFEYTDPDPLGGHSFYYVRLRQQDDNFAWGTPIWVSR